MALLDSGDYPAIRAAIDPSLTEDGLPDAIIDLSIYSAEASNWVLRALPAADSLGEPQHTSAKNAAIWYCAALLAMGMPALTAQTLEGTGSYQKQVIDPFKKASILEGRAVALLGTLINSLPIAVDVPMMFTSASGYRGSLL